MQRKADAADRDADRLVTAQPQKRPRIAVEDAHPLTSGARHNGNINANSSVSSVEANTAANSDDSGVEDASLLVPAQDFVSNQELAPPPPPPAPAYDMPSPPPAPGGSNPGQQRAISGDADGANASLPASLDDAQGVAAADAAAASVAGATFFGSAVPATPSSKLSRKGISKKKDKDEGKGPNKVSCMECRNSKVRCSGPLDEHRPTCERCRRLCKQCEYHAHRRGRRPKDPNAAAMRAATAGADTSILSASTFFSTPSRSISGPSRRHVSSSAYGHAPYPNDGVIPDDEEAVVGTGINHQGAILVEGDDADAGLPALSNPLKLLASAGASRIRPPPPTPAPAPSIPLHGSSQQQQQQIQQEGERQLQEQIELHNQRLQHVQRVFSAAGGSGIDASLGLVDALPTPTPVPGRNELMTRPRFTFSLYAERLDLEPRFDVVLPQKLQQESSPERGVRSDEKEKAKEEPGAALLKEEEAEMLFDTFMRHINGSLTLLDPHLHTFNFLRRRSHGLLAVICALASKFTSSYSSRPSRRSGPSSSVDSGGAYWANKSHQLDKHVHNIILPAIMLEGFRSVELVQALIIAAAFHPPPPSLNTSGGGRADRSWAFLGHAICMGAELDLNGKMLSTRLPPPVRAGWDDDAAAPVPSGAAATPTESLHRRLRNRERTWLNCYLFEQLLSAHTGRRPTLSAANDPVVLQCDKWHLPAASHGFAIPDDEAIVALVQLQRVVSRLTEFWERSVGDVFLTPGQGSRTSRASAARDDASHAHSSRREADVDIDVDPDLGREGAGASVGGDDLSSVDWEQASREALVDTFRRACDAELESWRTTWCSELLSGSSEGGSLTASSGPSEISIATANGRSKMAQERLQSGLLYFHYASLLLQSHVLRSPGLSANVLQPSYLAAYTHATSYLREFLRAQKPERLRYAQNSTAVTACYCAIFTLRLTELEANNIHTATGPAVSSSSSPTAPASHTRADVPAMLTLIRQLAEDLELAGKVTAHRQGLASNYAAHLRVILAHFEQANTDPALTQYPAPPPPLSVAAHALNQGSGHAHAPGDQNGTYVPWHRSATAAANVAEANAANRWTTGESEPSDFTLSGDQQQHLQPDGGDGSLEALDRFLTESLFPSHNAAALPLKEWLELAQL
ncbi:hypothetical protein K437DRAFT_257234 [Tilletiaria anomala UBC 951]|uniref:Zn(2)-C6 fungal-type domain-containing protein n=1 Tax=Tilletiaria anomala (strain ATCC 24038 / CBS 436.72 / UBC 951) TaxID=1037660 RepID=A0A066VZW8_TILAU|nr:uncharacterized protein K437DRAFT_257234 [Tilletiaria anomala UBC 951]KDN44095.1 hypothetical protein K437DRAFT_257234 [Tilletiaria anomala UBC 951]